MLQGIEYSHIKTSCAWSDLWKKAQLKHSLSPERPQIVEKFVQQLMEGAEEAQGQVGKKVDSVGQVMHCNWNLSFSKDLVNIDG